MVIRLPHTNLLTYGLAWDGHAIEKTMVSVTGFCNIPLLVQNELSLHLEPKNSLEGFPTFLMDYPDTRIDLTKAKIKFPRNTYFVQVTENSLYNSGIQVGDVLVLDRSIQPYHGAHVLAYFEGDFVLRRIEIQNVYPQLLSDDPDVHRVEIEPDMEFSVWGVVRDVLKGARVR